MNSAYYDYPAHGSLADGYTPARAEMQAVHDEAREMLREIDRLRRVATAAWAWKRTKYAMHGNTTEASRRHAEAVQGAERHLRELVDQIVTPSITATTDLREVLRRHVTDWGSCDHPGTCACSHAVALRRLEEL